jgi:nucleoside-diphosphate-sugar epimerase
MASPTGSTRTSTSRPARETVAELARVIWEACGEDPDAFALEHLPTFEVDVVRRWPSVEKAKRLLGWEAQIGLEQGIADTVSWLRTKVPALEH